MVARFFSHFGQLFDKRIAVIGVAVFLAISVCISPFKSDFTHTIKALIGVHIKVTFIAGASPLATLLTYAAP